MMVGVVVTSVRIFIGSISIFHGLLLGRKRTFFHECGIVVAVLPDRSAPSIFRRNGSWIGMYVIYLMYIYCIFMYICYTFQVSDEVILYYCS